MAESSVANVQTYQIQLNQVEAALTNDANNPDLLKLKEDLIEIIALTKNVAESQETPSSSNKNFAVGSEEGVVWKVGDKCMAQLSKDNQWYNAVIDAITEEGMVAVTFDIFGHSEVTDINLLHRRPPTDKQCSSSQSREKEKSRKWLQEQRLIAKKKKQKKFERLKLIDEAHEKDKRKWQAFATKNKKLKGFTKKSIFATPENPSGRVGIGTCGIGGKPMTEFSQAEKWRKGT